MISRKERARKMKKKSRIKYIASTLILALSLGIGNVALAGGNASSLLSQWFDKKANESITQIDQSIQVEKDKALKKLQAELQADIKQSEKDINAFTQQEKEKRVQEIQRYTDELISKMDGQDEETKKKIQSNLDAITQQAKQELNQAAQQ